MKVLLLYAHPVETSFVSALHQVALRTLQAGGHAVDDCDLYAEGFDPVLSRQDRIDYHDKAINRRRVAAYVGRLQAAEALLVVHPVWNFGLPAILKGFFDRVFLPGVSFELEASGTISLQLRNLRKLGAVCTYGSSRWQALLMGDPPRKIMTRYLPWFTGFKARVRYHALYHMNTATAVRRRRFLVEVRQAMERL